jgi:hypothetical protein
LLPALEFVEQLLVILLSLHENVLQLAIGGLQLPCLLLQLLEGGEGVIEKLVEPLALVFVLGPLLLELLELNRAMITLTVRDLFSSCWS